jgi:ATP-binding protein involved in chromosome partitioning
MPINPEEVAAALAGVREPELRRNIKELGLVRSLHITDGTVRLTVALVTEDSPANDVLIDSIRGALEQVEGIAHIELELDVLTDEDRRELRLRLHGDPAATDGTNPSVAGHTSGRTIPFADLANKTRCLLIASGKGGVGKSSVTTNLAIALARRGHDVAIVDADVWGFSIPKMLGIENPPTIVDQMMVAPEAYGVRCISMGFFAEEDQAVIWRGPMLHKALEQFLTDVYWDGPDYLLVDLPPGTGDVSISIAQFMPRSEMYVVTTPQPAAQRVAQRAAAMGAKVNIQVRGVIENMSWFTGDDGKRYEIFGTGGGQELATKLGLPLLGQIPLVPDLREGGDSGVPIIVSDPDSEAARAFVRIAEAIDVDLAPTRRYNAGLKLL